MNWFEALLLGILQGLTEFLPISSSGHLELGSYFLKIDNADIFDNATTLNLVSKFKKKVTVVQMTLQLLVGILMFC